MSPSSTSSSSPAFGERPYDVSADGPTRYGPRKRRKVARSKAGCMICRKRKKLCDMVHPTCGSCVKLGKECEWPSESTVSASAPVSNSSQQIPENNVGPPIIDPLPVACSSATDLSFLDGLGLPISGPSSSQYVAFDPGPQLNGNAALGSLTDLTAVAPSAVTDRVIPSAVDNVGANWDFSLITDDFFNPSLDEATLQHWSSGLLYNPLEPAENISPHPAHFIVPTAQATPAPATPQDTDDLLLIHFESDIIPLLSSAPSFAADDHLIPTLFTINPTSSHAQGLKAAALALSAQHKANRGDVKYEVISQRKEEQARERLLPKVSQWNMGAGDAWDESEKMTVIMGLILLIRAKTMRGDIWSFEPLHTALAGLSSCLQPVPGAAFPITSLTCRTLEQLVFLDLFSTYTFQQITILPKAAYEQAAKACSTILTPFLGISLSLFGLMQRVQDLVRHRRATAGTTWDDDQHVDTVDAADELLSALREEKKRLDVLIKANPTLQEHRFLHEALRTACQLQLRGYVLLHAPGAIDIGLSVRQNLSLLETMLQQKLPGLALVHWVLFITAINCVPSKNGVDERVRVMKLYQALSDEYGYTHYSRSRRVVEEVWRKNQDGALSVDWMNILVQWGWELFFL